MHLKKSSAVAAAGLNGASKMMIFINPKKKPLAAILVSSISILASFSSVAHESPEPTSKSSEAVATEESDSFISDEKTTIAIGVAAGATAFVLPSLLLPLTIVPAVAIDGAFGHGDEAIVPQMMLAAIMLSPLLLTTSVVAVLAGVITINWNKNTRQRNATIAGVVPGIAMSLLGAGVCLGVPLLNKFAGEDAVASAGMTGLSLSAWAPIVAVLGATLMNYLSNDWADEEDVVVRPT